MTGYFRRQITIAVCASLFFVASCSRESILTPPECGGIIELIRSPQDTLIISGSQSIHIGGEHLAFRQSMGQKMSYSALPSGTRLIVQVVQDSLLEIAPGAVGVDTVEVIASDECGSSDTARLFVRVVRDLCPSEPYPNEADYLPLAVGNSWTYEYSAGTYTPQPQETSSQIVGTLQWTVTSISECHAGQREYTITEQFAGVFQTKPGMPKDSPWSTRKDSSWQRTLTVVESDRLTFASYAGMPEHRYLHTSSVDTVGLHSYGPWVPEIDVLSVRGIGIVRYHNRTIVHTGNPVTSTLMVLNTYQVR